MEKTIKNGKVKYLYTDEERKHRLDYESHLPKKEIDFNHIVSKSTQSAVKHIEFCTQQITRLQKQINFYNEIRKENQKIAYGN